MLCDLGFRLQLKTGPLSFNLVRYCYKINLK